MHQIALCEELDLEEAVEMSSDRLMSEVWKKGDQSDHLGRYLVAG